MRRRSWWIYLILSVLIVGACWCRALLTGFTRCTSFTEYTDLVKASAVRFVGTGAVVVEEPHLILTNHIKAYYGLGSLLAIAGVTTRPTKIICFESYTTRMWSVSGLMHRITQHEIRVDYQSDKRTKETVMYQGIRQGLEEGFDVAMFIDAGDSTKAIRSLHRTVLGRFPGVQKQLVHLFEPRGRVFQYERYPATHCMDTIVKHRLAAMNKDTPATASVRAGTAGTPTPA